MPVPFIDLKRFEPDFLARWAEECAHLTRTTQFVGGPVVGKLEEKLRELSGATAVVGCANGTDALQLALRAVGVGEDDLVLIPDATFWATFESVVNVGAHPITVDIDPADLQMDFDLFVSAAETHKPKAAILVHLYGWGSAKLAAYREFCKSRGIHLIEDGAQAHGVTFNGESIYKGALLSTVSFYPAKVLGSCGDAGAVYSSSVELADVVRKLGNHGRTSHYGHGLIGWNSRLAGFDAGFLNLSIEYMDARLASRRKVAARYRDEFKKLGVKFVAPPAGYLENGYLSVALIDPAKRAGVEAVLKENGIGFGNVYPGAMSQQPAAASYLHAKFGGENADLLSRSVLNLPLFAYMTDSEVDEVIRVFTKAIGR
ncbi:DegT/DnrJ/EryC1/StrS family aminotransferase [Candidatus Sumerlaeota bacterium]|nr:DegT/DnrJ/EryC1/StrS family aminotransferase [Candidatus Sumerlaeota bacterium]